jgi:hypothetical protein
MKMDWIDELRNFGARSEDVVVLEGNESPSILPYLDLVEGGSKRPLLMPEAVVEVQHQPLLYLYSEAHFSVEQQLNPVECNSKIPCRRIPINAVSSRIAISRFICDRRLLSCCSTLKCASEYRYNRG